MTRITVSNQDVSILRGMASEYINRVGGSRHLSGKRNPRSQTSIDITGYEGPFKVTAILSTDSDTNITKLQFYVDNGYAIGGRTTVKVLSFFNKQNISEYNAVKLEEDDFVQPDEENPIDVYQLNVIAEIWWQGTVVESKITVTPSEVVQNKATDIGGTPVGEEIPNNDENGYYYARYQLGRYRYVEKEVDGNITYYEFESRQDQYGNLLMASRYI